MVPCNNHGTCQNMASLFYTVTFDGNRLNFTRFSAEFVNHIGIYSAWMPHSGSFEIIHGKPMETNIYFSLPSLSEEFKDHNKYIICVFII